MSLSLTLWAFFLGTAVMAHNVMPRNIQQVNNAGVDIVLGEVELDCQAEA